MWAFDPLSGEGAKKQVGRFNCIGSKALYTSLDLTTAWLEAQQGFPFKAQPMTIITYDVDCANIVDLNDTNTLSFLGFNSADLACAWEDLATQKQDPPTWQLVKKLQSLGVAGIKCRSFAPGCTEKNQNLVLWEWSDTPPHSIRIIDDFNRLPKSKVSWKKDIRGQ
jgi:RES domain-containing protein